MHQSPPPPPPPHPISPPLTHCLPPLPPLASVHLLQDELKREYILLEREHREKIKIKKQIQANIQDYYTALVEKKGLGKVITEDRLSNSYNFVKDLVLSISKDVRVGFEILYVASTQSTAQQLSELLLAMFYDNFNQNDPYHKKTTIFAQLLGKKISEQIIQLNFLKSPSSYNISVASLSPITQILLKQFCILEQVKEYFQMLANKVLNKIPNSLKAAKAKFRSSVMMMPELEVVVGGEKGDKGDAGKGEKVEADRANFLGGNSILHLNNTQSISINYSLTSFSLQDQQIDSKIDQAVQQFKLDIISKAQMMPILLRVLCYTITTQLYKQKQKQKYSKTGKLIKFIWDILQNSYFRPFQNSNANKWNHFKNSYFTDTVNRICQIFRKKCDSKFLEKLVERIVGISRDKLARSQVQRTNKIVIHGGCVSYRHLYFLFKVVKDNDKHLKPFNQRVTNRANKILQMNPNFQFFQTFKQPSTSYLVFTQINYGPLIQKDYLSLYSTVYSIQNTITNKIKDMIKQILVDSGFGVAHLERQTCLIDVLRKIVREQEVEGEGMFSLGALRYSQQFVMKIKFLVFLMESKGIQELGVFQDMVKECLARQESNIDLFKKNKTQLLQCLTTVSKAQKLIKTQKQAQRNVDAHLKIVKILDTMQISICITSPSAFSQSLPLPLPFCPNPQKSIQIQDSSTCPHQQNIEQGLKYHACCVQEAVNLFCQLKEVRYAIQSGKDSGFVYEGLSRLIDFVKDTCRRSFSINMEEYHFFQTSIFKVVMREIHQQLIETTDKMPQEIEFQQLLKSLSFIKPNRLKLLPKQNIAQLQQIWQIACRYLKTLLTKKSPTQKIDSIVQMLDIIKISLKKQSQISQIDKTPLEHVLAYCLIRSKPQKILININYIEIFLSKDKLLSKEGAALQRLKNAVGILMSRKFGELLVEDSQMQEELERGLAGEELQRIKDEQRAGRMNGYI